MSKQFGLIGYPLVHSISAPIHTELFLLSRTDATYKLIEIPHGTLDSRINDLLKLSGFNITIPYKQSIIKHLRGISDIAAEIGAVNVVTCENGFTGDNTDAYGFKASIDTLCSDKNAHAVILGTGGVARTMVAVCLSEFSRVTVTARNLSSDSAHSMSLDFHSYIESGRLSICGIDDITDNFNLLVNATPVGMYPDIETSPASEMLVSKADAIFDSIYNPQTTRLIQIGNSLGKQTMNGLRMLVLQAAKSHEIWYGKTFTHDEIEQVMKVANTALKNR